MKISKETKEQIRKEPGKFLSCVSKVITEKILYPEDLFPYMGMKCPKSESESIYTLYGAMRLFEEYGDEYWYTVCKYSLFFKDDFMNFLSLKKTHEKQCKLLHDKLWVVDYDLQRLLDEEV